jgi:hypothetical protein
VLGVALFAREVPVGAGGSALADISQPLTANETTAANPTTSPTCCFARNGRGRPTPYMNNPQLATHLMSQCLMTCPIGPVGSPNYPNADD